MTQKSFSIEHPHFTGPFDLLLTLIEERKLLISDFSLASVADDFIKHINEQEAFPIEETAEFLVVAATLMFLKSKSLLPHVEMEGEEEEDAKALEKRLIQYKIYREQARVLAKSFGDTFLFPRKSRMESPPRFVPGDLSLSTITEALNKLFSIEEKIRERALPEKTMRTILTLNEAMEKLKDRLTRSLSASFRDLSGMGKAEKVEVIVHFLALLELVKQGSMRVEQSIPHGDISMSSEEASVPHYG